MRYKTTAHAGYWYVPLKGLSLVAEPYVYVTRFKLAPQHAGGVDSRNVAYGAMLGSMYQC
jgi:hypothetical protein